MGFSQCNYTVSGNNDNPPEKNPPPATPNSLSILPNYDDNDDDCCGKDNHEVKFRSFLTKMVWDFGFGCFMGNNEVRNEKRNKNPEHNKAWLLAESGGDLANGEPHSLHSSFRFNICSQVELDTMKTTSFGPSTTVLMVNLDSNLTDSSPKEIKLQRFQHLEKSISPIASSLIRFSYGEILSATRNFSQGIYCYFGFNCE